MRLLPSDFAKCVNETCPLKDNCLRAAGPGDNHDRQVFASFVPVTTDGVTACEYQMAKETPSE